MGVFELMKKYGHEQVLFCHDKGTGLRAIIAIHDTCLGPAMGGCRIKEYNSEEEALQDALLLSRAMTFKNSMAGINYGGGKSVIWISSKEEKEESLIRSFARFVESLKGRYFTAQDIGSTHEDMEYVYSETKYMLGRPEMRILANPSEISSYGVMIGMKVCLKEVFGNDSLRGRIVAIQGMGKIGYYLARFLAKEGAELWVTDIDEKSVKKVADELKVKTVPPDAIYETTCDVFSPCAVGGILNEKSAAKLKCKIVAGGANNPLENPEIGDLLHHKGILYAPDFAINSGGAINGVALIDEIEGQAYHREQVMERTGLIIQSMMEKILSISKQKNLPTHRVADMLARERIEKIRKIQKLVAKQIK